MIRKRLVGSVTGLLAGLLAGCAGPPEPAPAPEPPPSPFAAVEPAPAPAPQAEVQQSGELCPALAGLVARGGNGFAGLRGASLARERWRARETLPGTERCTIEGDAWPRARFECAAAASGSRNRTFVHREFDALVAEIDRCLASPVWFPRDWQKGQAFRFAMGERMQTWTDRSTRPPTAVVLKVQRDIENRDYELKLNLQTVR